MLKNVSPEELFLLKMKDLLATVVRFVMLFIFPESDQHINPRTSDRQKSVKKIKSIKGLKSENDFEIPKHSAVCVTLLELLSLFHVKCENYQFLICRMNHN